MEKFGPAAPNFGCDFFVNHFFRTPYRCANCGFNIKQKLVIPCVFVLLRRANLNVTPRVGQKIEDGFGHRCQSVAVSLTRFVRVPLC